MSTRDDSRLRTDSSVYLLSLGDNAVNLGASRAFLMVCVQLTVRKLISSPAFYSSDLDPSLVARHTLMSRMRK